MGDGGAPESGKRVSSPVLREPERRLLRHADDTYSDPASFPSALAPGRTHHLRFSSQWRSKPAIQARGFDHVVHHQCGHRGANRRDALC